MIAKSTKQLIEQATAEIEKPRTNWSRVRSILAAIHKRNALMHDWRPSELAMAISTDVPNTIKKLKALKARHRSMLQSLTTKGI